MTLEEARPWLEYRGREIMFREAFLAILTGGASEKKEPENEYCTICREAKKDHCETCNRTFRTIGGKSDV